MYCSTCGVAVAQSLSYCNYCGAKLGEAKNENLVRSSEIKPELVVAAMVATFVLGLIAITMLIGVMKSVLGFETGQILAFGLLSFLIMILLEGVFLRLLFRRPRANEGASDNESSKGQTKRELDAPRARALQEPGVSVTEHTTRAFEPIYVERNKGE